MAGAVAMIYLSPVTMPKMIYVLKYAIIVNLVLIAKELILNDDKGDMKKCFHHEKTKHKRSFLKLVLLLLRPFY